MAVKECGLIFDNNDARCQFFHADGGATGIFTPGGECLDFVFITVIEELTQKGKRYCGFFNRNLPEKTNILNIMRNGSKWPPAFNQSMPYPDGLEPYE